MKEPQLNKNIHDQCGYFSHYLPSIYIIMTRMAFSKAHTYGQVQQFNCY